MRSREQSILSEILPPEERVIEAVVARYQRVAPAVTRFARSLADNDALRVRLGAEASAGPDDVVLDPGVFQAAYARSAPVTPEEVALASALHEVVHLISTDFEDRRPIPASWLPVESELLSEVPVDLLEAIASTGGPAAEALFFALEDARQEFSGMAAYQGARSVLEDLYNAATPSALGSARPLGQFALACFLLAGRYADRDTLERRSAPHVAGALADATPFLDEAVLAQDPWEVGYLALQLLSIARLHGLVAEGPPDESPHQKRTRQEADSSAVADAVDQVRMISPVLRDAAGYDSTKRAAEARAGAQGRKAPADLAGDASTDQILRVSLSPTVYLPTGQTGKLIVSPIPDRFRVFGRLGREALATTAREWGVAQRHVSGELHPLFVANQRRGLRSGFDNGDLSPHSALLIGAGLYQRMYERRDLPTRRAYAVSLLVDGSASMLQPRRLENGFRSPWGLSAATLGAWTLAHLCDELQVDFEIALFNRSFAATPVDTERAFTERRHRALAGLRKSQGTAAERLTSTVNHYLVKSFDQPWRRAEDVLAGLFWMTAEPVQAATRARRAPDQSPPVSMFEKAANVDEFNLAHAAERMLQRRSQVRVLVVLADGMTRGSVEALAATVHSIERGGTTVLGIGIGDATVQAAYSRNQVVEQPEALTRAMVEGVRSALRRSLALWGVDTWWSRASRQSSDPSKELIRV
jgi:hypothetical protein